MTDAERILRAAIDCAHPVTGEDHDAVDGAHEALDRLVAENERLRAELHRYVGPGKGNEPVSERDGLIAQLMEAEAELVRVRIRADANRTEKHHLEAALRDAVRLLRCYEDIEFGRPVRNMDEAVVAWSRSREALGSGWEGTPSD